MRNLSRWIALTASVIGIGAVGAPACALVAGLEDHTVEQPNAGAGGSVNTAASAGNTSSSVVGSGSTGGAGMTSTGVMSTVASAGGGTTGSGGGGGGMAPVMGWPDSPTAHCTSPAATVTCPTDAAAAFHGQDGDIRIHVPVYQTTANHVVDPVTGLMWRRAPLAPQSQKSASGFCASQPFDGFDDWRLPNRLELISIVDYGATGARIDHTAFPGVAATLLWSSTQYASDSMGTSVWSVDFGCTPPCTPNGSGAGNIGGVFNGNPTPALCVRGTPLVSGDFTPPSAGTITDDRTGLVWQVNADPNGFTWLEALHNCRDVVSGEQIAGFGDWRLPSIKELLTLVDDSATMNPVLLPGLMVGPAEQYLWSSTPDSDALSPVRAYLLGVFDGSTTTLDIAANYGYAHCVRGP